MRGVSALSANREHHSLSAKQLRNPDLQHLFRGVVSADLDPDSVVDLCRAFEPLLAPGEVFSHSTAFQLLGGALPTSLARPWPLHLIRTAPHRKRRGVVTHVYARSLPPTIVHGLPVTGLPTVWCQLADLLPGEELVAAGDFLVSATKRRAAYCTVCELAEAVERHGSRRGRRALDWALPLVRTGPDSRPESLLRVVLIRAGLPEPAIHHPVPLDGMTAHPDLSYPDLKIAIEYEGDQHRTDRRQRRRDLTRYEMLQDAGWRVIRVHADDLFGNQGSIVRRVHGALRAASK